MVRAARYAYVALAWAFVAGVVLQVFFIGLGLFAGAEYRYIHAYFGWTILHLSPLIILVAAPLARAGRTRILQAAALAMTVWFVPILAVLRADAPVVAALHPVGALLAFWLAIVVARGATSLVGSSDTEASPTRGELAIVAVVVVILLFLSFSGSPTEA
jgi:nicotinamide riboside transporter PnuC